MEIESREESVIEDTRTEITEKVEKRGVHAIFAYNPIWIIWTIVKNSRQDKKNRIKERWIEYSNLINYMPKTFLHLLTTKDNENKIITPQESFMNYFSNKKVKDDIFLSNKFIEHFHANEKYLEEKIIKTKSELGEGVGYVNEFWKEFENILVHPKKSKRKERGLLEKCESAKICYKIKKWKKVLLNGTGKYHLSTRNNSYLRINKV